MACFNDAQRQQPFIFQRRHAGLKQNALLTTDLIPRWAGFEGPAFYAMARRAALMIRQGFIHIFTMRSTADAKNFEVSA